MSAARRAQRRWIRTALPLGTLVLLLSFSQAFAQNPYPELRKLYSAKRFFELRDTLLEMEGENFPELSFYRGAVDNIFNRLPSSITHLLSYLEKTGGSQPAAQVRECYKLLADSYRK